MSPMARTEKCPWLGTPSEQLLLYLFKMWASFKISTVYNKQHHLEYSNTEAVFFLLFSFCSHGDLKCGLKRTDKIKTCTESWYQRKQ